MIMDRHAFRVASFFKSMARDKKSNINNNLKAYKIIKYIKKRHDPFTLKKV